MLDHDEAEDLVALARVQIAWVGGEDLLDVLERIAQAAGMSKPTFYKYFPSSSAAISELFADCNQRLRLRIEQVVADQPDLTGKINAGIDAYPDWSDEIGDALIVFLAEEASTPATVASLRTGAESVYSAMMEGFGAASGMRVAPEMTAMLLAALRAGARQYQADPRRRSAVKESMLRFTAAAWSSVPGDSETA